jgi:putative drug exporter of the RND superfamily
MLERFGRFIYHQRRWVLIGTLVVFVLAFVFGGNVAKYLRAGGFESPDVESTRAAELLGTKFNQAPPNFLVLVTAKQGTVNDQAVRREGIRLTNELLGEERVGQVLSHWSLGPASPLQSRDRTHAMILAEIEGDDAQRQEIAEALTPKYTSSTIDVETKVGGFEAIFAEVSKTIEKDLAFAESIAIPITLILLIVVFGSLVAASLPVAIGVIAVFCTFLVLRLIALQTEVSVFALSMVTAMGLGLAIDYSLFIVSRFREELRKGADTEQAIATTMATAGRTVIFSGITVAVSLAALLVFPLYFFKSFGYAGIGVVFTAVLGAVVFLPAMLAVIGPRIDWAPTLARPRNDTRRVLRIVAFVLFPPLLPILLMSKYIAAWQQRHHKDVGEGFWHRLAMLVMRRPVIIAVSVVAVLLLLGAPFLHVNLGLPDERVLPPQAETRQTHEILRKDFPSEEVNSTRVIAPDMGNPATRRKEIAVYAASLSKLDGVASVDSLVGTYTDGVRSAPPSPFSARFATTDSTWFQVLPSIDPFSKEAEDLAVRIREGNAPFEVLVGGTSAQLVDAKDSLFSKLPLALGIIAIATFVMLFLMFGSLLVPLKALVLNLLSLTATFGAMVWIFQDGHLSGFLNFTSSGTLDISSPILMFCIAFGLSMDFEVFLLSRIKEEYDQTGNNEQSVAVGLERTGRIVTAAAVLISVTFLLFGMSQIRFIKLFGIGMTLAVLMDAFVIRGTLVPAFMRLAGNANWWLPSFLRPVYRRFQIKETHEVVARPAPTHPPTAPKKPRPKAKPKPIESRTTRKAPAKRTNGRKPSAAKRKPAAKRKVAR